MAEAPEAWMALYRQRRVRPYLMESLKAAEGNAVEEFGRAQNALSLVNVTKKPGLHLVRKRKLIKDVQQESERVYIWAAPEKLAKPEEVFSLKSSSSHHLRTAKPPVVWLTLSRGLTSHHFLSKAFCWPYTKLQHTLNPAWGVRFP